MKSVFMSMTLGLTFILSHHKILLVKQSDGSFLQIYSSFCMKSDRKEFKGQVDCTKPHTPCIFECVIVFVGPYPTFRLF